MIMAKFELNLTNIDKASQTVTDFLSNEKVAPKEVQRIRLSVEEILLKYFDSAGNGVNFEVITSKRFRTLKIELAVAGDSIDPFSDGDGEGLNGMTPDELLSKLEKSFVVEKKGASIYKPNKLHNFSMYLAGEWYSLTAKEGTYNDSDPIGVLDVTILTEQVLSPLFDIQDLRRSQRIDFVGGIRGLGELKKRVDSGEMQAAFALYPVSMEQLMNIADSGEIMPPKSTWFEPKLRSGLILHSLV